MLNLVSGGICYCRTYHCDNTWDREHHIQRICAIGKKKSEVNHDKLKEAASLYGWKNWKTIYGD